MLVASDSESDLPVFPLLNPASKHDSHGFLETFFRMKSFLPDFKVTKLLLDSAHDAMPVYEYCKRENIVPFIDLNEKRGIKVKYKDDFTIGKDGIPRDYYLFIIFLFFLIFLCSYITNPYFMISI